MSSTDRLVAFLYVLMRDDVVPGRVEEILIQHIEVSSTAACYSNTHLEAMAKEIAVRLS